MNLYEVVLTEKATYDINDIYNYISRELYDIDAAERLLNKIEHSVYSLKKMPKRNPLLKDNELSLEGIRRLLVENYVIFYLCSDDDKIVTVLRVLYNKRNWIDLI